MSENKTYCILNYGCQGNQSDAEHYAGQLEEMGYTAQSDYHDADVILVNTCCVRESAEKKIAGKIGELKAEKRLHPDTVICVAGCMAQKDGEKLLKKHPQVDLLLGTSYVNDFKRLLGDFLVDKKGGSFTDLTVQQNEFEGHMVRQSSFSAWIPIMYGCNNFCTYCIVPHVRGRERSRSEEDIVREIEAAVKEGYIEFTLLGQNVNNFGKDRKEPEAFAKLLRRINAIPGVERIRYITSNPWNLSDETIKAVAECEHVCENFHLPVQSGSNRILKAMNRHITREDYFALIAKIREQVPDAAITTDIIVGFPGETDEDFADTLDLVDKVGLASAFTFIYSKRSGTPAAKMENQVDLATKKARLNELMALQNKNSLAYHKTLVGKTMDVLAEGPSKKAGVWSGRTRTGILVLWPVEGKEVVPGQKVNIQIEEAMTWQVKGKAID